MLGYQPLGASQLGASQLGASQLQATQPGATQDGKKERPEDKQTVLPVTIRLIERALEQRVAVNDPLRFFGTEQGMLLVIGIVENLVRQPASIEFRVNDATGRIKARYFVTSYQAKDVEAIVSGQYIQMFGHVRTTPEFHFAVTGLHTVSTPDAVSYHMIECVHAALKLQKARVPDPTTPTKTAPAPGASQVNPNELSAPKRARLEGEALRNAVVAFLQRMGAGKPEGVHLSLVCEHVDPTPMADLTVVLAQLVEDGEVFTTIDDKHFSCV